MSLLRLKHYGDDSIKDISLKRSLGLIELVAMGLGVILGAGIFSMTGYVIGNVAGPATIISFVIAGGACFFSGLCYAEIAGMIPVSGSAYSYVYSTMGELMGWIIGWDLVLEWALGCALVTVSWSRYFVLFLVTLHINVPYSFSHSPLEGGLIDLPALIIIIILSLVAMRKNRESSLLNIVIVMIKLLILISIVIVGISFIHAENFHPFIVPQTMLDKGMNNFGWPGIYKGAGLLFFAYIGFESITTAGLESKKPQKHLPLAIIISLAIATVIYVLFAIVMVGVAPYQAYQGADGIAPIYVAIKHFTNGTTINAQFVGWGIIITVFILIGFLSTILIDLIAQSRMFMSMSLDGLLPKMFADLHPKHKTPYKNNLAFMILIGLSAAFLPLKILGELSTIGTLLSFVLVCIGVLLLRKKQPHAVRKFKVPKVNWIAPIAIIICLSMMLSLGAETWIRLFLWMAIGILIYIFYGYDHSRLATTDNSTNKDIKFLHYLFFGLIVGALSLIIHRIGNIHTPIEDSMLLMLALVFLLLLIFIWQTIRKNKKCNHV
ncbi:MAG: amino acid permease [Phycisphaerales bacterium]|nr:amino acid permease [Phycisphaerales bacterium]